MKDALRLAGKIIKKRREHVGQTQEGMAEAAGLSQSLISQVERGVQDVRGLALPRFVAFLGALEWNVQQFQRETELLVPGAELLGSAPVADRRIAVHVAQNSIRSLRQTEETCALGDLDPMLSLLAVRVTGELGIQIPGLTERVMDDSLAIVDTTATPRDGDIVLVQPQTHGPSLVEWPMAIEGVDVERWSGRRRWRNVVDESSPLMGVVVELRWTRE